MAYGRILIAEDEDGLREALELFLEGKGYEVKSVADGQAALDELETEVYDLLITDIRMPNKSGTDLIDALAGRDRASRPEIVVMTAYGTVDAAIGAINVGISSFLRKPLKMEELEAAVSTAVDRRRIEGELRRYYTELDSLVEERTRQLTLLNRFSEIVNRTLNIDKILDGAAGQMAASHDWDASWIYLEEGDPPRLELRASRGLSGWLVESVGRLDDPESLNYSRLMEGDRLIKQDLMGSGAEIARLAGKDGLKSAMAAPIRSGDRVLGILGVASREGYEFQQSDIETLASMGNQIGVAIERARLFEREKDVSLDLHRKVDQLVILNEMGNMIRVSPSTDLAANAIVHAVAVGLGFMRVCLWVLEEDGRTLRLAASYGVEGGDAAGMTVDVDKDWLAGCLPEDEYSATECPPVCDIAGADRLCGGAAPKNLAMAPLVARSSDNFDKNCWEYFGCEEADCAAYLNPLACWMVEDSCKRKLGPARTLLDKLEVCKACDVYRYNQRGRNIGVMCVDRGDSGGRITLDEIKSLNVYANTAAAALENIRLMERLSRDERFIDSIIFNMASGLLVTDTEGRVRMINYAGCEILGSSSEKLVGNRISEIFPEVEAMLEVEESPVGHEVGVMTKDGPVPVGYSNSHVITADGRPDGVIVVFRDLSDIKAMQDQLRDKERFAAIGRVAAGVAHEIRNPLFGITSVAQIIGREVGSDTPQKALIDAMLSETSRLNTLVEELLMYGRPTKLSPQPINLHELLTSVFDFYDQMIRDKGVEIVRDFCNARPEILADPHQIRQVFLNVLVNSLDAVGPGGRIKVGTYCEGDAITTVITDSGSGVPEDDIPKLFDLFYTTKEKGTGLGLPICRKIIEDHGGNISITSEPGVGTTVKITLPLGPDNNSVDER